MKEMSNLIKNDDNLLYGKKIQIAIKEYITAQKIKEEKQQRIMAPSGQTYNWSECDRENLKKS